MGAARINVVESFKSKITKSASSDQMRAVYSNGAKRDASAYLKAKVIAIWAKPPKNPAKIKNSKVCGSGITHPPGNVRNPLSVDVSEK